MSSLEDAAAQLRQVLAARALNHASVAAVEAACSSAGVTLAQVVEHDAAVGEPPSLLLLAAAAGNADVTGALAQAGAKPLPGEDVFPTLVEAVADSDCYGAGVDSQLYGALPFVYLTSYRVHAPLTTGPSRATVICLQKRWDQCLARMVRIDPWAMHHLQSHPDSIAAAEEAEAETAALTAAVAAGDRTATRQAANVLFDAIRCIGSWPEEHGPLQRAAARAAMHAMLQVHHTAGTLRRLVMRATRETDYFSLMWIARYTKDIDAVLAFASAGARSLDSDTRDVYDYIIGGSSKYGFASNPSPVRVFRDASGVFVPDERLAVYFKRLYDAGVHVDRSVLNDWEPSDATLYCARDGYAHCLRVMVEVIDPFARSSTVPDNSVFAAALEACRHSADCITYLRQAGWDVCVRDIDGCSPMDYCICMANDAASSVAAIATFTAGVEDVRPLLRNCMLVMQRDAAADPKRPVVYATSLHPFAFRYIARILLHMVAAVRETPAALLWTSLRECHWMHAPHVIVFRCEALDAHSVDGVYIPDLLRAGGDVKAAVKSAVQVDAIINMQALLSSDGCRCWERHVRTRATPLTGVCQTVMSWAFMRRLHALKTRRGVMRAMTGTRS